MAIDPALFRELPLQRLEELEEQDRISATDRNPVTLDQESVGRLSRSDTMHIQAMVLAQERGRKVERSAIAAAFQSIESGEFGYCIHERITVRIRLSTIYPSWNQ